jgi:acetyltransferase-like isoleucine patch superfamily enzyme
MRRIRGPVVRILVPIYLSAIVGIPLAFAAAPLLLAPTNRWRLAMVLLAAPIFCTMYVIVAGLLSGLTLRAIVAGRFPRDLGHEIYGPRRLYALCWTAIYYCGPIYHVVLALPWLKRLTFRLFGYRGSLDFQTYPDTWLRDLPLLSIGKGAYLSNKATISPNMCLKNGKIIVMPVSIGDGSLIGHMTMIAPGVTIGADSEVGVGVSIGVRARIGASTLVDHITTIDHEVTIGDRCTIGLRAYVGRKAVVMDGIKIPPGAIVPARSVIASQADADACAAGRPSATHAQFAARMGGGRPAGAGVMLE